MPPKKKREDEQCQLHDMFCNDVDDLKKKYDNLTDPMNGALEKAKCEVKKSIDRLHERINGVMKSKVSWMYFAVLIGLLVGGTLYSIKNTYAVDARISDIDSAHKDKYITIEAAKSADDKLAGQIQQVQEAVKETNTSIQQMRIQRVEDKADILRAIESLKK